MFKAELIRNRGPWTGIDDVEIATAEWVHWFNTYRPHGGLSGLTPQAYRASQLKASTDSSEPVPVLLDAR